MNHVKNYVSANHSTNKISNGTYGKIIKIDATTLLKVTDKLNTNDTTYLRQNIHESVFLASVKHKNIVECRSIKIYQNKIFMELERGEMTLHDFICKTDFTERLSKLKGIFFQLIKVLCFIHKNNFIHGDLKPNNIIYNPETNIIKLIDFGGICSFRLSNSHRPICTHSFCPPEGYKELNKNSAVTDKFDIWSLGMTIYYYLTKTYLMDFKSDKVECYIGEFKNNMNVRETPNIGWLINRVDKNIFKLLHNMLIYDKNKRISSHELLSNEIFNEFRKNEEIQNIEVINKCEFDWTFSNKYTSSQWFTRQKIVDIIYQIVTKLDCKEYFVLTIWLADKYYFLKKIKPNNKNYKIIFISALLLTSILICKKVLYFTDILEYINDSKSKKIKNKEDIINVIDDMLSIFDFKVYVNTFDCCLNNIKYNVVHEMLRGGKCIGLKNDDLLLIYSNLTKNLK